MSSSTDATPPTISGGVLAEIRVPRETVNDDVVTVQEWHAAHAYSQSHPGSSGASSSFHRAPPMLSWPASVNAVP